MIVLSMNDKLLLMQYAIGKYDSGVSFSTFSKYPLTCHYSMLSYNTEKERRVHELA